MKRLTGIRQILYTDSSVRISDRGGGAVAVVVVVETLATLAGIFRIFPQPSKKGGNISKINPR
jgi:hypothetical protein